MAPLLRRSPDPLLAHLLYLRYRWFFEGMVDSLPEVGLATVSPLHCRILSWIDRWGVRTAELARRLGVTRQAAHDQVRALRAQGLVELRPDPTNRSAKRVVLTESGGDVAREVVYVLQGMEELLSHRIGEDDLGVLARILSEDWGSPLGPVPEFDPESPGPEDGFPAFADQLP